MRRSSHFFNFSFYGRRRRRIHDQSVHSTPPRWNVRIITACFPELLYKLKAGRRNRAPHDSVAVAINQPVFTNKTLEPPIKNDLTSAIKKLKVARGEAKG
jgi:hypothetical protein